MLSLKYIRDNMDYVQNSLTQKNSNINLSILLDYDNQRKNCLKEVEELRAERNKVSVSIAQLKKAGVNFNTTLNEKSPAQIIELEGDNLTETYIGFHNFYVITTYNRNVMYALSVILLGQKIQSTVN